MLSSITLIDFKSFGHAELPLGPLTVLIGANAAGKSNAIEGLRLLSWMAQGQKLGTIQYLVQSADRVVRGRIEDLSRKETSVFGLGCKTDDPQWNELEIAIEIRNGELHIREERIKSRHTVVPLYVLDQPSTGKNTDVGVAYNNFAKGGIKPHVRISDQMAIFSQFDSPFLFMASNKVAQATIPKITKKYSQLLSNILFLDPNPAKMREYSFVSEHRMFGDGSNLSSTLLQLWGEDLLADEKNDENRQDILGFIQSLPEQDIEGLGFLSGPRGEVMVTLTESFGGRHIEYDASLLSDGTLRVLAIAAAMLSAPEGGIVVIEEIDNGVHPSRAHHLLERIRYLAEKRKLRVVLSTHNPALLDALPIPAIPDVVYCYRDPNSGLSKLVRLQDIDSYEELVVKGPLGRLMTQGLIEKYAKHRITAKVKQKEALAWLAKLKVLNKE